MKIIIQCPSCGGTGLYSGLCEPQGTAVVCLSCNGSAATTINLTPFDGRKRKKEINEIRQSRGTSILSWGGAGTVMTYSEFEEKFPPQDINEARRTYQQL